MAKKTPLWKERGFDSKEELHFAYWLDEAYDAGYVLDINYHPEPFILSTTEKYFSKKKLKTKTKTVEKHLLNWHTYQADFRIVVTPKFDCLDHGLKMVDNLDQVIFVDIKGKYQPVHSKTEVFSINQKWMYQKFGIYVHKIVPEKFFEKTWVPEACAYWENGSRRIARYSKCKLLAEIQEEK